MSRKFEQDDTRISGNGSSEELVSIRQELQALGLRPDAARLLVALLRRAGSANSAELSEISGVSRTNVYRGMKTLVDQGLAEAVPTFGPARWTCPRWERVVDILDAAEEEQVRRHHERTEQLRQGLAQVRPVQVSA